MKQLTRARERSLPAKTVVRHSCFGRKNPFEKLCYLTKRCVYIHTDYTDTPCYKQGLSAVDFHAACMLRTGNKMLRAGRGHTPIPLTPACLEAIQEADSSGQMLLSQPLPSSFLRGYFTEIKVFVSCLFLSDSPRSSPNAQRTSPQGLIQNTMPFLNEPKTTGVWGIPQMNSASSTKQVYGMSSLRKAKEMLIFSGPIFACQTRVVLNSPRLQLTVEQAQLQKRCQSRKDHEEQESSSPPQKPDHRAHGQAGCQRNPSHGVVVRVEVVGDRHLRFVPHHAFRKTVVYAITGQPRGNRRGGEESIAEQAA